MQTNPGLERKPARPFGGKSNAKPSASLVTVGCEGRPSKIAEHRETEPIMAYKGGKAAKSVEAQYSECFYMLERMDLLTGMFA